MEKEIENLIEELTKVRTSMLNEEALKLFNTIMAILDERDKLIKENTDLKEITNKYDAFANDYMPNDVKMIIADREYFNNGIFKENFIPKSKIKEKIEPVIDSLEKNGFVGYADELRDIISELMEDKQMSCEYCEELTNIKEKYFDITIVNNSLVVGNECSEGCGYDKARFNINYCPMCGRKLGG